MNDRIFYGLQNVIALFEASSIPAMRDITESMLKSLEADLFYPALLSAMVIPDMCGALGSKKGYADDQKYKKWFDEYAAQDSGVDGEFAYNLRCAIVHQGWLTHRKISEVTSVMFTASKKNRVHLINFETPSGKKYLCLDIIQYCLAIAHGVIKWQKDVVKSENFENNLKKHFRLHENGISGILLNVPIIAAIP